MIDSMNPLLFWGTLALQLIGLASVVIARLPCRCPLKSTACRVLFVACLLSLAVATMVAIHAQNGAWAWCGTTFSLMAVGVSVDLRSSMAVTGF
ncbi:hypothetical protein [Anatilimnocola floriformis]|uniref:hypothetical protein n=1 Tax=Anatilimnocola floriformis TaxID=2948575 RepID=UPI0020C39F72|nr:hypothetical protein [Anatilimnocola floriformis]